MVKETNRFIFYKDRRIRGLNVYMALIFVEYTINMSDRTKNMNDRTSRNGAEDLHL
jgi:hypothetical protein